MGSFSVTGRLKQGSHNWVVAFSPDIEVFLRARLRQLALMVKISGWPYKTKQWGGVHLLPLWGNTIIKECQWLVWSLERTSGHAAGCLLSWKQQEDTVCRCCAATGCVVILLSLIAPSMGFSVSDSLCLMASVVTKGRCGLLNRLGNEDTDHEWCILWPRIFFFYYFLNFWQSWRN